MKRENIQVWVTQDELKKLVEHDEFVNTWDYFDNEDAGDNELGKITTSHFNLRFNLMGRNKEIPTDLKDSAKIPLKKETFRIRSNKK